jgi:glucose/arabinose dehydrogenase
MLLAGPALAVELPDAFQEQVVFTGLTQPTAIRFAPDGRIFIAEKSGLIKVFDGLNDSTPDTLADLRVNVHNYWDRGLLGMAVDPQFPAQPFLYVFYTYNFDPHDSGSAFPRWPDFCPNPPGANADGCTVNGRISRLEVATDNTWVGGENVLLENHWCQQYPSHSVGDLVFSDHERVLYASAGDGASFTFVDYGQDGSPRNPCDDAPVGQGGAQSPPGAEGGSLRSQDIRTSGDPVSLDGSVIAIDPDSGAPASTNPLLGGDTGDDVIIAHGLRNPYRLTYRDGTHEVWIADVGKSDWEEINRISNTEDSIVENFGWPCYEGAGTNDGFDDANLTICEDLYDETQNPATAPYFTYEHDTHLDPDPTPFRCSKTGSSAISGLAFYTGSVYPELYSNALFFADYSRDCLFVMLADTEGDPDPTTRATFVDAASNPVDLRLGPDGLLYYVDISDGRVLRINYFGANEPPSAVAEATPSHGSLPLNVQFDGAGSSDPNPQDTLEYAWDLDGDGAFDDSTATSPTFEYRTQGEVLAGLRVRDDSGDEDFDAIVITAGNTAPAPTIDIPSGATTWQVDQEIFFQGHATDLEDGALLASQMQWQVDLQHCPGGTCHSHFLQTFTGVSEGSFTAPDHEWYSFLELTLTVSDFGFSGTDGGILTAETKIALDPRTVALTFETGPPGLKVTVGGSEETTPFSRTVIVGSNNTLAVTSPQTHLGMPYFFDSWSDGGSQNHELIAPAVAATYTAILCGSLDDACDGWDDDCDGTPDDDAVVPGEVGVLVVGPDALSWTPVFGSQSYQLIRGDLNALRSAGGDFSNSVAECLAEGHDTTIFVYSASPSPGEAHWFLVRGRNCAGGGTYDTSGGGQSQPRDGIEDDPDGCGG